MYPAQPNDSKSKSKSSLESQHLPSEKPQWSEPPFSLEGVSEPNLDIDNMHGIYSSQLLVNAIEKVIKDKILPATLNSLVSELEKRNIWTPKIREQGKARLMNSSLQLVDFQLDKMDVFMKENIFKNKALKVYIEEISNTNHQMEWISKDLVKKSQRVGKLYASQAMDEMEEEIEKRMEKELNANVQPSRIGGLEGQLERLEKFLQLNQGLVNGISKRIDRKVANLRDKNNLRDL